MTRPTLRTMSTDELRARWEVAAGLAGDAARLSNVARQRDPKLRAAFLAVAASTDETRSAAVDAYMAAGNACSAHAEAQDLFVPIHRRAEALRAELLRRGIDVRGDVVASL